MKLLGDAHGYTMYVAASKNGSYVVYYLYPYRHGDDAPQPDPLWCVDQPHNNKTPTLPSWHDMKEAKLVAALYEARARYLLLWRQWVGEFKELKEL